MNCYNIENIYIFPINIGYFPLKEDNNSLKMAMTSSPLNISNVITIMNCWAVLLKIKEVHLTRK